MKSVELFAGAGGLGIGLHQAGFHPLNVIEWDRYCCDTIRENQARGSKFVGSWRNVTESDVRAIDFKNYEGRVELISGGPPCQPFSLGGRHKAHGDTRDMFPQAIRAVREARPKAFVFENVKGLTRTTFRNYFEYIRLQLEHPEVVINPDEEWLSHLARLERHHTSGVRGDLHYRVVTRLLNAANFGVPQRRERVVLVGFRDDLSIEWSFPTETHSLDALLWDQAKGDYWERHKVARPGRVLSQRLQARAERLEEKPVGQPWRTVRDAIHDLPSLETSARSTSPIANHRLQLGARSYPGHSGSPFDEAAKTLKAGVHGVPGGENMLLQADGAVRYFSVRESARLQTFPDDFVFHGSWTETMRQLGNAVPVLLARKVGESVRDHLKRAA